MMNKRILELANEAGFYVRHDKGEILIPTTSEEITQWQIKFAELIIEECVDICRLQGDKLKYERKMQAMLDARLIKEHFGVE
jgi:hypothetical protein